MKTSKIKGLLSDQGKTQKALAEFIGVSENGLKKMMDKGSYKTATLAKIAEFFDVEPSFLYDDTKVGSYEAKAVPYYDIDASAGNVTIFAEDGAEYVKEYITVSAFSDCEMFINISGNSMYPKYCSGEQVALKKLMDYDVVSYGEAYLLVTKEQRLLKYIRKSKDKDKWLLCSENPDFDSFEIDRKKVLHLYIVKGKITKNII